MAFEIENSEPVAENILPVAEARKLIEQHFSTDKIQTPHTDSAMIDGIAVYEFWTQDEEGYFQTRFVTKRDSANAKPRLHTQFSGLAHYLDKQIAKQHSKQTNWANQPDMVKFLLFFIAALLVAIAALAVYSKQTPFLLLALASILVVIVYVLGQIGGHDKLSPSVDAVLQLIGLGKKP